MGVSALNKVENTGRNLIQNAFSGVRPTPNLPTSLTGNVLNAFQKTGVLPAPIQGPIQSTISAPRNPIEQVTNEAESAFKANLGARTSVSPAALKGPTAQTPTSSSASVSPAVLNSMSPTMQRSGHAAVPVAPAAPTGNLGVIPPSGFSSDGPAPAPSAPANPGASTGAPFAGQEQRSAPPLPSFFRGNSESTPSISRSGASSFGAAVPLRTLIESIGQRPDGDPAGLVNLPDQFGLGSRPRRKTRDGTF